MGRRREEEGRNGEKRRGEKKREGKEGSISRLRLRVYTLSIPRIPQSLLGV